MAKKASSKWRYVCVALLLAAMCYGLVTFRLPFWVTALYFGMGLVSFVLYGFDKSHAKNSRRRIREIHLLLADLAFGIMGGLLGQQVFRHKTQKRNFILAAIGFTAFHLLVIFAVVEANPVLTKTLQR